MESANDKPLAGNEVRLAQSEEEIGIFYQACPPDVGY
jgi:hypothetical protein